MSTITSLDIKEFTDNVQRDDVEYIVTGNGIFDTLMETATQHLKAQFEGNRFREEDYANAYVQIYQATLQAALQAWLQKDLVYAQIKQTEAGTAKIEAELQLIPKQIELMTAQIASENAKVALAEKQKDLVTTQITSETNKAALYRRQIEGFDEDYKQKILKIMMDSWSVGFSVAKDSFEASGIPATMQKVAIDDLYNGYIKSDFDNYKYKRDSAMLVQ